MIVNVGNAVSYLREQGLLRSDVHAEARELKGGVSNTVILISPDTGDDFVLKQSRERLNVSEPWFCSVERIWRETEVLKACDAIFSRHEKTGSYQLAVPRLLFEDRRHYLYAMTAAPRQHTVWKHDLMSGHISSQVALGCGELLGCIHAGSWHDSRLEKTLGDQQFFHTLRLDPYYRHIARVHADISREIELLIHTGQHERHCLVHGDYSPKNILVSPDTLFLIDFEVGHYGDPAFDLGFFLSHLMLKAFYKYEVFNQFLDLLECFWSGYRTTIGHTISEEAFSKLVARSISNLAACMIARVDGKSPVEYLEDATLKQRARQFGKTLLFLQDKAWDKVTERARKVLETLPSEVELYKETNAAH